MGRIMIKFDKYHREINKVFNHFFSSIINLESKIKANTLCVPYVVVIIRRMILLLLIKLCTKFVSIVWLSI